MSDIILWLLILELIGLIGLPIVYSLLPNLWDRGFAFSKITGLLILSISTWALSVTSLIPNTQELLFAILIIYCLSSAYLLRLNFNELRIFIVARWKLITLTEVVFIATYFGFIALKFSDPSINHTEQPMDHAFLTASIQSETGGAQDPWMRGETISYYYFGYWMFGSLAKLSGIAPEYSYNLALAVIPALTSAGTLCVAFTILGGHRMVSRAKIAWAGISVASMVILANLHGLLSFMRENSMGSNWFWKTICIDGMTTPVTMVTDQWHPTEFWWWFRSTRIINYFGERCDLPGIDYTINEFPFFSFLLGDLHPHVMVIPLIILFIGICISTWKSKANAPTELPSILFSGVTLGAIGFTNMWSLPVFTSLLVSIYVLRKLRGADAYKIRNIIMLLFSTTLILMLFSPYLLDFKSSVTGLRATQIATSSIHGFIIWAPLLSITAPFAIIVFWETPISRRWRLSIGTAMIATLLPWVIHALLPGPTLLEGPGTIYFVLPLTLLFAILIFSTINLNFQAQDLDKTFILLLFTLAISLILGPELLYIGDVFNSRMNTVFKLHYQAWILLSVVACYSLYYWQMKSNTSKSWIKASSRLWGIFTIMLFLSGLYYAPAAVATKTSEVTDSSSLDGLNYLSKHSPSERNAIEFVRKNLHITDGILEAVGEWADAGLISRSTGRSNIINWPSHQKQWRGDISEISRRESDVKTIYTTQDPAVALKLLNKYEVEYIYVSNREIKQYGSSGLKKFDSLAKVVFGPEGNVVIYRLE